MATYKALRKPGPLSLEDGRKIPFGATFLAGEGGFAALSGTDLIYLAQGTIELVSGDPGPAPRVLSRLNVDPATTEVWAAGDDPEEDDPILALSSVVTKAQLKFAGAELPAGYDVVLIAPAQSNAQYGTGGDTTFFDVAHDRVDQYVNPRNTFNKYPGRVVRAVEPLAHRTQPATADAGGIGHDLALARMYADALSPHRRVLLVPCGQAATGFVPTGGTTWDIDDTTTAANLAREAIDNLKAALAIGSGHNRVAYISMIQGENDRNLLTTSEYQDMVLRFFEVLREEVPEAETAPVLIGGLLWKAIENRAGLDDIDAAHRDLPRLLTYSAFAPGPTGDDVFRVTASETFADPIHYSAVGQRGPTADGSLSLAESKWAVLPLALANAPDVAPVAPASVTVTQVGTSAVISFPAAIGRATNYVVEYRVGSGSWTTITHDPSIVTEYTVTGRSPGDVVTARVSTVNDEGTSAPRTSSSVTFVAAPGQTVGLTLGLTLANSQALTWTATSGAASYRIERSPYGAGTWTSAGTSATNSGVASGLSNNTRYDYRVVPVNAAGDGTASTSVDSTTLATAPLAAVVPFLGDGASWSVARINVPDYTGPLFRVRRSSDDAEIDIYAGADQKVDTAALAAFVGSGSGYTPRIYDQTEQGRDFVQATAIRQPIVRISGTNVTLGGILAVEGDGTRWMQHTLPGAYAAGACSTIGVYTEPATATSMAPYGESKGGTGAANARYFPNGRFVASSPNVLRRMEIVNAANITESAQQSAAQSPGGAQKVWAAIDSGTTVATWKNGVSELAEAAYTRSGVHDDDVATLFGWGSNNSVTLAFVGKFQELTVYHRRWSSSERADAIANAISAYSIS